MNATQLFRKDLELVNIINNNVVDSKEIENRKNFYKQKIYQMLDGKTVGRVGLINHNEFDHIVPTMMAFWELGCTVFVHDFNPGFSDLPWFKKFYEFVDFYITWDHFLPSKFDRPFFDTTDYNPNMVYPTVEYVLDGAITDETIAVRTHSSGTTGIPKLIDFTHGLVTLYAQSITQMHNYNSDDRPYHWKTLHHSSLFLSYAVPLMAQCSRQYYMGTDDLAGKNYDAKHFFNLVLPLCKKHQLTRMLVPYDWIQHIDQADPVDLQGQLQMIIIRGINKDTAKWAMDNINPREIVDQFGCSEVGAMFIKRINQHNVDSYQPKLFDEIMPNIEYRLNESTVDARWAGHRWYTLADIVRKQDDGQLFFEGRTYSIERNGERVYVSPLEEHLVARLNSTEFHIVADLEINELFLAVFSASLSTNLDQINNIVTEKFSDNYKFSKIKFFDISTVRSGMKPSAPLLLYAFRSNND